MGPDLASFRMDLHALRISVPIGVNGFFSIWCVIKGIVFWYTAIVVQSVDFATISCYVLWIGVFIPSVANCKKQITVIIKNNSRSKMFCSRAVWICFIKQFFVN